MFKIKLKKIRKFSAEYLSALVIMYIISEITFYRKSAFSADFFNTIPVVLFLFVTGVLAVSVFRGWIVFDPRAGSGDSDHEA
jgi:hypothetical protein